MTRLAAGGVDTEAVITAGKMGKVYAYGAGDGKPLWTASVGKQLWTATARAGINSFPGVASNMLLVGAAATGFFEHPRFELTAYSLA